jgi:hypothetical protein
LDNLTLRRLTNTAGVSDVVDWLTFALKRDALEFTRKKSG